LHTYEEDIRIQEKEAAFNDTNNSDLAVNTVETSALSGNELSEYSARIRSRQIIASAADGTNPNGDINSNASRRDWGLEEGGGGGNMQDYGNQVTASSYNNVDRKDSSGELGRGSGIRDNSSYQDVREDGKRLPLTSKAQTVETGRKRKQNDRISDDASARKQNDRRVVLEDGEEFTQKKSNNKNGNGYGEQSEDGNRRRIVYNGNNSHSSLDIIRGYGDENNPEEDEYIPDEAGEEDEEENEAELLLAALDGRKH
jgi:hypothetical protein